MAIHFSGEAHSFVCFAGMVKESGAEEGSLTCSGSRVWELLVVCVQHQRLP
jgi:hypothetical protein